jgi:hypothetical protein
LAYETKAIIFAGFPPFAVRGLNAHSVRPTASRYGFGKPMRGILAIVKGWDLRVSQCAIQPARLNQVRTRVEA